MTHSRKPRMPAGEAATGVPVGQDKGEVPSRDETRGMSGVRTRTSDGVAESAREAAALPDAIGRYRILEKLGEGGMGEVYVGHDETLGRRVALKSIRSTNRLSEHSRARFLREARVLSRLEHPNICQIHDYIQSTDRDFLVLELVRGRDLTRAVREGLDRPACIRIALQIADVLAAAHAEGVVHRDLKPDNVMLADDGEVKVLDFGLARAVEAGDTEEEEPAGASGASGASDPSDEAFASGGVHTVHGSVIGTPHYMSPEQARGEPVHTASDMYSFGLLLQALFSAGDPYPSGLTRQEILEAARNADTVPVAGLGTDLTSLIQRLKSPAVAVRPTAVEALDRLRRIQEKPARRLRRFIAAAVVVVIVGGAVKYTLDLRRERTIADQRRAQAEDLISFMLGDLRLKLEPVGRLEVLDDVGDKALDYFASLSEEDLTDDELFRRSKALSQIGEVRIAQGNLAQAMRSFEESATLAADLVARDAANGEWQFGLGTVHFWIGYVHWLQGNQELAAGEFEAYLASSMRLVKIDPDNADWRMEVSYAHNNLGSLLDAQGDVTGAIEQFELSANIKQELVAAHPSRNDWRKELADSLSWLGGALEAQGDLEGALERYGQVRDVMEHLSRAEPDNTHWKFVLGISHHRLAWLLGGRGEEAEARRHSARSLEIHRRLVERDSANTDWKRELAGTHQQLGELLGILGETDRALRHLQRAADGMQELHTLDASNVERRRDLASALTALGRVRLSTGSISTATALASRSVAAVDGLLEANPGDLHAARLAADAADLLGVSLARAGREEEAHRKWQWAVGVLQPAVTGKRDPSLLDPLARVLIRLGRQEEARPILRQLAERGYRRFEIRRLCEEEGIPFG